MGHLQENGFKVNDVMVDDLMAVKHQHGVAPELASCHTALIGDYVIEGHVPADAIKRFLAEGSSMAGLTVPGMPSGPPGMESLTPDNWDVLAFDRSGNTTVYESH